MSVLAGTRRVLLSGRSFRPSDVGGLQWWLAADEPAILYQDAAMTIPATLDLDPVGGWKDKSPAARNATQATAAARPVLKLGLQNGRNAVRFDGVDDLMSMALPALATQWIAYVISSRSFAATHAILGGATDNQLLRVGAPGTSMDIRDNAALYQTWAISAYSTAFHQIDVTVDGVNVASHLNGAANGQAAYASAGITWAQLGRRGVNDPAPIDVGEMLIYSAIPSEGDRVAIRSYLRTKWGTP